LEFEENDAKTQGRVFVFNFSGAFSTLFFTCCRLKNEFLRKD
jgi:hypothetical protein